MHSQGSKVRRDMGFCLSACLLRSRYVGRVRVHRSRLGLSIWFPSFLQPVMHISFSPDPHSNLSPLSLLTCYRCKRHARLDYVRSCLSVAWQSSLKQGVGCLCFWSRCFHCFALGSTERHSPCSITAKKDRGDLGTGLQFSRLIVDKGARKAC